MSWMKSHPFIAAILVVWCTLMVLGASTTEDPDGSPEELIAVVLIMGLIGAWTLTILSNATVGRSKKHREKEAAVTEAFGVQGFDSHPAMTQTRVRAVIPSNGKPPEKHIDSNYGQSANMQTIPSASPQATLIESSPSYTGPTSVPPKVTQPRGGNITLREILDYTPSEFEDFCAQALNRMGYQDMKRNGGAGDLQADIVGRDIHGRSTIVQCKRYKPGSQIGSPVIQSFIGMKSVHHRADRGIFITTAGYSRPAEKLAQQHDIVLIDGDDLVKLAGLVFAPRVDARPKYQVRFCTNCGSEIESHEDRFCSECGSAIQR